MSVSGNRYLHSMFFVSGCEYCIGKEEGWNEIFCRLCKDHVNCSDRGDVRDTHIMVAHSLTHNKKASFMQSFDQYTPYYGDGEPRSDICFYSDVECAEVYLHERVSPYVVMLEKISDNVRINHLLQEHVKYSNESDNQREGIYYSELLSASGGIDIKLYDYYYTDLDDLLNKAFTIEAEYRCPLCELEYDCFPSGEVFVEHMKKHYFIT